MIQLLQSDARRIPLADESVHCVVTSPPYYGLRSYAGLGEWIGGDAECDHVKNIKPQRDHNGRDFGDTRGNENAKIESNVYYGDVCGKCGATRAAPHDLEPIPATVLDPFCGSGTTLMVARQLGRSAVGLDLSWPYLSINARERIGMTALDEWTNGKPAESITDGLPLFEGIR